MVARTCFNITLYVRCLSGENTLSGPRMLQIVLFCITKGHCFPKTLCHSGTNLYVYSTALFLESVGATHATAKEAEMKI